MRVFLLEKVPAVFLLSLNFLFDVVEHFRLKHALAFPQLVQQRQRTIDEIDVFRLIVVRRIDGEIAMTTRFEQRLLFAFSIDPVVDRNAFALETIDEGKDDDRVFERFGT